MFSGADVARETAAGLPHGRAVVYKGRRHGVRGVAFERDLRMFLGEERPRGDAMDKPVTKSKQRR